jgi:hypothetical protein
VPVGFFWKLRPHGAAVVTVPYWCAGALLLMLLGWTAGKLAPMAWSRALGLRMVHYAFAGYTAILRFFDIIRLEFVGFEKWPADATGQILAANHPSPLSALRPPTPFIGCGHFSQAQDWLAERAFPIDWSRL